MSAALRAPHDPARYWAAELLRDGYCIIPDVMPVATIQALHQDLAPRLEQTCRRVVAGETNMFTGVMCGSYHDVWMELHEDLILTQRIDRAKEGSF